MDEDQITCIQNVRIIFKFFQPFPEASKLEDIETVVESLRNLGHLLEQRFSRIASMVEILKSAHNDWKITSKKDRIIMETETFDFNYAVKMLTENGFKDEEYILKVEYERKWGML
ncbi:hypothetical protein LN736_04775 [Clostridium sp. WLY-B-L2]|uniref:Uncharacterized protein n=1 Tax=Clostridium aromativorans TaxID=2836848 RepID=A0ABS8N641_9CLOT|nr:hypothetical protein [Clostridium aromativorans]